MECNTDTFRIMNALIGTHSLSDAFIWSIIGPEASTFYSADTGYVEFAGETLKRMERVYEACEELAKSLALSIPVNAFMQHQVLALDTNTGTEYKRAGDFIASGMLSVADAVDIASESTQQDIADSKDFIDTMEFSWRPSKSQPFLRAIHK